MRPDEHGEADKQLQLLNVLEEQFPEHVVAASYDYLKEEKCSAGAFLICNATLQLTDSRWKECRDSIDARSAAEYNLSPPRAAIDVVVLARAAYEMKRATHHGATPCKPWPNVTKTSTEAQKKHSLVSSHPNVLKAAKQLPLRWGRGGGGGGGREGRFFFFFELLFQQESGLSSVFLLRDCAAYASRFVSLFVFFCLCVCVDP